MKNVCALIPMYNEEKYAYDTIKALKSIGTIAKIVVIDDGSTDKTWEIISRIDGIERLQHIKNFGKAQSIIDGIKHCNADIYVFVDGDLGNSAKEIKGIINSVLLDECDLCIAKPLKSLGGGFGFLRFFSRFTVKLITGIDFGYPLCGQRAVKREVILNSNVKLYNRYGIEVGMLIGALNCGYRVKLLEIDIVHRFTGKNIAGFVHRSGQFLDIFNVFIKELKRW